LKAQKEPFERIFSSCRVFPVRQCVDEEDDKNDQGDVNSVTQAMEGHDHRVEVAEDLPADDEPFQAQVAVENVPVQRPSSSSRANQGHRLRESSPVFETTKVLRSDVAGVVTKVGQFEYTVL
jgi:hypothetical protein